MKRFHRPDSGQVLPLFALFLVVLLGFAALAIDISRAYSDLRFYRSVADAASLAGAQDLQQPNSRAVNPADYPKARQDAMASLRSQLGATGLPSCDLSFNVTDCALPGTPYLVSIKTPSPTCSACDPARSVQVTVRNPDFRVSFARVFGEDRWNVGVTSVSGLVYGRSYTIITLRPPKKTGSTFDVKDISLEGGTHVTVQRGDVGSNANMNFSGVGTWLRLDSGYGMYYFDPLSGPAWGPTPPGQKLPSLIPDPNYRYPNMTGAPTWTDARTSIAGPLQAVQRADVDAACKAEVDKVDVTRYTFMATQPLDKVYCYNPGIYDRVSGNRGQIVVGTGEVALLKPGAYYLKGGLDVSERILGGYEAGAPGVALMFDECLNTCIFSGNNAKTIALNAGTKFPPGSAGTSATAAVDWTGQLVQTSGPSSPNPPILITLLVRKDPNCFVPTSAPWIEPSACDALKNKTLNIAGGGSLALEGVQYAPTDNIEISGGSTGTGQVGQIISWTLKYSGGTEINQQGPQNEGPGTLRLDAACTAPGEPCNP